MPRSTTAGICGLVLLLSVCCFSSFSLLHVLRSCHSCLPVGDYTSVAEKWLNPLMDTSRATAGHLVGTIGSNYLSEHSN